MDDNRILATFNAYNQDEVHAYAHLYDYIGALSEIRQGVRQWWKHGHKFKDADEAISAMYELVMSAQVDRGLEV